MLDESRAARRTDRILEDLFGPDGAAGAGSAGRPGEAGRGTPGDEESAEEEASLKLAATTLRSSLVRVHPSFRFEEALAGRLAETALRLKAGLPMAAVSGADPASVIPALAAFRAPATTPELLLAAGAARTTAPGASPHASWPGQALRRLPGRAAQSRPFIVGGVGVASAAALSLGAVYVAWRRSRPSPSLMTRVVRAAHGRSARGRGVDGVAGMVS